MSLPLRGSAGLYSRNESCPFPVSPDGAVKELSFGTQREGDFPQLLSTLLNELDANPARIKNPERRRLLDRIAAEERKVASSPTDIETLADLGADLVRAGKLDAAAAVLEPRRRDRVPDFRVLINLAHVHAARGEWPDAVTYHSDALDLADFPSDLAGTDAAQRKWLKAIERKDYRQLAPGPPRPRGCEG